MTTTGINYEDSRVQALHKMMAENSLSGHWLHGTPAPELEPRAWPWKVIRDCLEESGEVVEIGEADSQAARRTVQLINPALTERKSTSRTLQMSIQLVKPGEIAECHRHTAAALRFIVESTGAFTAVEGERTTMHPGDFILTPSWTYHDHGNPGDAPVVWLDGLDVPIVNLFDTSFAERHPDEAQPNTIAEGDAQSRYGANMLPVDYSPARPSSPVFNYPYSRSREALEQLYRDGPVHACHGVKMRYVNPATGGYPMPTIGAFLQLLPRGFRGEPHRATDATVYSVVEGSGRTRVGDQSFDWGPRDIFVAPSWYPVSHQADQEAVIFSFSDRPAQKALGLWREEAPVRV